MSAALARARRRTALGAALSHGLAAIRVTGFIIVVLALGLALALAPLLGQSFKRRARRSACRAMTRLAGVEVVRDGEPCRDAPTLIVPNHLSYLDTLILASEIDARFVAKDDIGSWPVIGWITRAGGAIFVKRHWREALAQSRRIACALDKGDDVLMFPEGTSTDGRGVARFKSSLFSVAEPRFLRGVIAVQPVTLTIAHGPDGGPLKRDELELFAWTGDATLAPHLWRLLRSTGGIAHVRFHPPIYCWPGAERCRKALAAYCRIEIAAEAAKLAPHLLDEGWRAPAPAALNAKASAHFARMMAGAERVASEVEVLEHQD